VPAARLVVSCAAESPDSVQELSLVVVLLAAALVRAAPASVAAARPDVETAAASARKP